MDCEIMNGCKATKLIIGYTALLGTKEQEECLNSGMIDTLIIQNSD